MMRICCKNIGFMGIFFWKHKYLYSHTKKYVYISWSLTSQSKMVPILSFSAWKVYANSKYLYLYKVIFPFKKICCIFCITILYFFKVWCAFGSFMQIIFSQTNYSMKTKFCSLPKDGVWHLKSLKPGLICTKYWF